MVTRPIIEITSATTDDLCAWSSVGSSARSSLILRELPICSVGGLNCHVHSSGDDFLFEIT